MACFLMAGDRMAAEMTRWMLFIVVGDLVVVRFVGGLLFVGPSLCC